MTIQSGTHLGPYEILSAIGAGGMGEVYRARDAKLGRDVALKVLPEAFARDAERMARFQREAKVLASLNHPNVATIHGLEDSSGSHALVMELVEGPTLGDRIKQGPIPIDEALKIAKQICEALEYAHERGVVHRDLKPANIKVTNDDAVKVLDFGLAKAIESDASSIDISSSPTMSRMATMQGVLLGTAAYMPPEQAKGKSVDRRADIWAFGCVLYEMLTGKMAFTGETVSDTLAAVIRAEPDWAQLPAATPARVRVLLQRCFQKDPKRRLQAIGEARISLDEVLGGAQEPSTSDIAGASVPAPLWRRVLPWAVAAAFAVAFAGLAFVYFGEKAPAAAEMVRFDIPMPPKTSFVFASGFAISPNGRELAFAGTNPDGTNSVWIRDMGSPDARPLAGTESGANLPFFWTADSKYLVFQQSGVLKKIEISSGVVHTLCDVSPAALGGSSNGDGVIIFGQGDGGLMRIPADGGSASPLTTLDSSRGEFQHVFPSFLPDGRHFLYLRVSSDLANSGIYIGSLDASPANQDSKRLLATTLRVEYVPSSFDPNKGQLLFLTSDGTLMAQPFDARRFEFTGDPVPVEEHVGQYINGGEFTASANGVLVYRTAGASAESQPKWFDRQGKIVGAVGEPDVYDAPALSPDGTNVVVGRGPAEQSALWIFDSSRGTNARFTFGSAGVGGPFWSPDGKRIIFSSNPGGIWDVYQKLASGAAGEDLLLKSSENKWPSDESHDGRFLLYYALDPRTKDDIWVLPLQGDRRPFLFLRTPFDELNAHFSPDGHWVAYESNESGRDEIYVRPFSGDSSAADVSGAGAKWQVSYGGGALPLWSADGKEVYYLTSDGKVMEVGVTNSPAFQAGTPKFLFQAPPLALLPSLRTTGKYTVDGKRFLFISSTGQGSQAQDQAPFNVVLNWQAALKQSQ
jgi:eukaryotic-like serine/threonine-protein kinase